MLADRAIRDVPLPKGIGGALIGEIITGVLSQLKVELVEKSPEESQEDVEFPGEDEE